LSRLEEDKLRLAEGTGVRDHNRLKMAWFDTSWYGESMAAIREKGNFITVPLIF
jgi:hypothetical protein